MSKRIRQYIGIFAAVVAYYIVHEGAHLITALYYGVFKGINFMGLGMQVDVGASRREPHFYSFIPGPKTGDFSCPVEVKLFQGLKTPPYVVVSSE